MVPDPPTVQAEMESRARAAEELPWEDDGNEGPIIGSWQKFHGRKRGTYLVCSSLTMFNLVVKVW